MKDVGGVIINPFCGLSCLFCGGKEKASKNDLKKQEIKIFKNLKDLKRQGIKKIEISGSDPLEYENIIGLIKYIKKEGFNYVGISTNGVKLFDFCFLKKIMDSGVDSLRIPIYGSNAKIHDSVTQTLGSFDKTFSGIKNLLEKKSKIKIKSSCLIVKQNKDDLLNIMDFINKLDIEDFYFSIPCIVNNEDKFYIPFKDIGPYLKKIYQYVLKNNRKIFFLEIPFCIFNDFNLNNINNKCLPPNLGKYNQPPRKFKTEIPDIPSYRIKKKIDICVGCKAFNYCDGFFVNDINKFGIKGINKI
jgi:MoaA/NifB/PqqE/SkfB family radical SAM enzyme